MAKLILDSDVILNWLLQEEETATARPLWIAPATILELGEQRQLRNHLSLVSLLEIRFVLRRKKRFGDDEIESDLRRLQSIVEMLTPTEGELIQAERLQSEEALDPFDSILLSQAIMRRNWLITRDVDLLKIAARYIPAATPEQYVEGLLE